MKPAIRNLPPFAPIAVRMLTLLQRDDVNYREVMDLLKTDAAFSAELLRLANSAAFGGRFRSDSIMQALSVVGIPRMSALTITIGLSRFLKPVSKLPLMRRCWRHNLATAVAASEMASVYRLEGDYAYTFGLLHDIGRLGLLVAFTAEYTRIAEAANKGPFTLPALELRTFGFDHREIGAWLAAQWHLPAELVDVCLQHGHGGNPRSPLTTLIHEACKVANTIGCAVCDRPAPDELSTGEPGSLGERVLERVNRYEQEYGT